MNYTQTLENLRKQISSTSIAEEVSSKLESAVKPITPQQSPNRGFAPRVASPRPQAQQQPQQSQYQPDMIVSSTLQKLQEARRNFEKRLSEQKQAEEAKAQTRPQIRPFSVAPQEEEPRGFMTRPQSRRDAILNRTNFDDTNRPAGPAGSVQPLPEEQAVMQAIKDIESGGGNYEVRGPVVQSGRYAGERAMGAYQVMPGNLPQWSRQALGREVSETEFMQSKEIQDAIFLDQMRRNYERYGTWEDAASVWFTGRPVSQSQNASDGYTSAPDYIRRFSSAYNRYRGE